MSYISISLVSLIPQVGDIRHGSFPSRGMYACEQVNIRVKSHARLRTRKISTEI
jgi:hypothetical protein